MITSFNNNMIISFNNNDMKHDNNNNKRLNVVGTHLSGQ